MSDFPEDDVNDETDTALPSEAVTVDSSDVVTLKKRERKINREKREEDELWLAMLASDIGRRAIWKLLTDAHTFETRFATGPNGFPQVEATWFQAGGQDFGLRLYQRLLMLNPVLIAKMHEEHDSRMAKQGKK